MIVYQIWTCAEDIQLRRVEEVTCVKVFPAWKRRRNSCDEYLFVFHYYNGGSYPPID